MVTLNVTASVSSVVYVIVRYSRLGQVFCGPRNCAAGIHVRPRITNDLESKNRVREGYCGKPGVNMHVLGNVYR